MKSTAFPLVVTLAFSWSAYSAVAGTPANAMDGQELEQAFHTELSLNEDGSKNFAPELELQGDGNTPRLFGHGIWAHYAGLNYSGRYWGGRYYHGGPYYRITYGPRYFYAQHYQKRYSPRYYSYWGGVRRYGWRTGGSPINAYEPAQVYIDRDASDTEITPVVVIDNKNFPVCSRSAMDPDGDGWGWETERSCRVVFNICTSTDSDRDGDGWGWENKESCLMPPR